MSKENELMVKLKQLNEKLIKVALEEVTCLFENQPKNPESADNGLDCPEKAV